MSNFDELDMELQERLKHEMGRVAAPEGFADRVTERVSKRVPNHEREGRLLVMPKRFARIAVAAMLLVGVVLGGWQWKQRELMREREKAAVVQRQFDMAMQVTERTLAGVQVTVGKAVRDSVRQ